MASIVFSSATLVACIWIHEINSQMRGDIINAGFFMTDGRSPCSSSSRSHFFAGDVFLLLAEVMIGPEKDHMQYLWRGM